MVVTPIIRDQLGWSEGKDFLVAENTKQLADKCVELFNDISLWNTLRENALSRVRVELSSAAFDAAVRDILSEFQDSMRTQLAMQELPMDCSTIRRFP